MGNVIPFPKSPDSFSKIATWISEVLQETELTDAMMQNVIDQYQEFYPELFNKYEAKMVLPAELGLNKEQADAISKAHTNTVKGIFHHHANQIAYAAQIILGLLAREQLNSTK